MSRSADIRRVLVIVPAYNEAATVGAVVQGIARERPGAAVLVVDDGSTDGSGALSAEAGAEVLTLPFNTGYGPALQTGIKYALRRGFAAAVVCDGDGQHDPGSIGALLAEFERSGADIVVGSRYLETGTFEAPALKRAAVRFFGLLAGACIGQRVTDPTSGFKALGRRAMRYYVSDLLPISFPDADAMITAHRVGLRIVEVPVKMHPRAEGRSMHDGLKGFVYFFNMLFSILVTVMRKDRLDPEVTDDDPRDAAKAEGVRGVRGAAVPPADIRPGAAPPAQD
ncbi:MAG: glycosyltransferase family 2 protein [Deltaproteobacteria bacterium]|nr:glycosyltransferase family 2 protein [Deltaproteobacteria bacterium]